jgi:hypothetical protein
VKGRSESSGLFRGRGGIGTETYRCGLNAHDLPGGHPMNRTIGISVGGLILLLVIVAIIF